MVKGPGEVGGQHQCQACAQETSCSSLRAAGLGSCFTTEVAGVTLTAHFTLHGQLGVLSMALGTKVSSQRQVRAAAAVQVTRRHTAMVTDDGGEPASGGRRLFYSRHAERGFGVLVCEGGDGVLRKA